MILVIAAEFNKFPWEVGELSPDEFNEIRAFMELRSEAQKKSAEEQRKKSKTKNRRRR